MRIVGTILLATLALPVAWAKAPQVNSIDVGDYGVFTADTQVAQLDAQKPAQQTASQSTQQTAQKPVPQPASPAIPSSSVTDVHLVTETRTIPMQKGVHFGFEYVASGKPRYAKATLHFVVIYPAPGVMKPGASSPILHDEYDRTVIIDAKGSFDGYKLENDWELVPGDWTLEIWNGNTKLASETFTLVTQ